MALGESDTATESHDESTPSDSTITNDVAISGSRFVRYVSTNWPVAAPLFVVVVAAISTLMHGWYPVSDLALIELKTSDIPTHFPLLGAYSRMGWAHPGPSHFVWMSIPYRLFGSVGMPLAMLGLHGIATMLIWRWTKHHDRLLAKLCMVGVTLLFIVRPLVELRSTWNPHVNLVMAALLLIVVWRFLEGDTRSIVVILPVSSMLIQSHLGNAVVVVGAVVGAAAIAFVYLITDFSKVWTHLKLELVQRRWWWIGGIGIAGVMWLPALIDQLTNDPGNISALLGDTGDEEATSVSIQYAAKFWMNSFAARPTWVGSGPVGINGGFDLGLAIPIWLILPVLAVGSAIVARRAAHLRLVLFTVVAHAVACLAIVTYSGDVYPYLVVWLGPITLVVLISSLWVVVTNIVNIAGRVERPLHGIVNVVAVVFAVWAAMLQTGDHQLFAEVQPAARAFAAEIVERADGNDVFIDALWDFDALAALPPLVVEAEKHGLDAITSDWQSSGFGEHRVGEPGNRIRFHVGPTRWIEQAITEGWIPIRTVAVTGATDAHGNPQERDSLTLFIRE